MLALRVDVDRLVCCSDSIALSVYIKFLFLRQMAA